MPAALVIGSWVPDLPYFLRLPISGPTHAPAGPVTVDLLLGLLVFAAWELLLRRPVAALSPAWLADRLPPAARLDLRRSAWAAVSLVLGSATHVVWDAFTHPGRWGTEHLAVLSAAVGPLPLYKWLQFGSGVLGLVALGCWVGVWVRRTPRRSGAPCGRRRARHASWSVLAVVPTVTVVLVLGAALEHGAGLEAAAFTAVTRSMSAAAVVLVLVCVAWHASRRRSS